MFTFYISSRYCCELPVFSLRSQTFCYAAEFSTTFLYMLKTKTFLHHKANSEHPKIQEFELYFVKNFCNSRKKRTKRPHPTGSSCAWAGLRPAVTRTLSTSRSVQTFFKHNVGNPGVT